MKGFSVREADKGYWWIDIYKDEGEVEHRYANAQEVYIYLTTAKEIFEKKHAAEIKYKVEW